MLRTTRTERIWGYHGPVINWVNFTPLRRNASFHVVAMDAVFHGDEELTRGMLGEIAGLVEEGAFTPLPFRAFPVCRVDAAFRAHQRDRPARRAHIRPADRAVRVMRAAGLLRFGRADHARSGAKGERVDPDPTRRGCGWRWAG